VGISTVEDACYCPPRRYEDRTHLAPIAQVRPGEQVTVRGTLAAKSLGRIRGGRSIVEAQFRDASGLLRALWFNQPYLAQQLRVGDEFLVYGQVDLRPRPQMMHPELERIEAGDEASIHMGRIVPVYPLVSGLSQRGFRQMTASALEQHADALEELLSGPLRESRGWPGIARAVRELHFPTSWEMLETAKRRLAFEELFLFQLALAQRRAKTAAVNKPQRYIVDGPLTQGLRQRLPFSLTTSQDSVLAELFGDLRQPHPMHRLLQGDVGCGKTVVMAFLIAAAVQSGWQAALMAPTELLAEQHARVLRSYLEPLGVQVGLLSQGVLGAERTRLAARIAAGEIQVVVGTHALTQTAVKFPKLSLVLIDEQHKFGVVQRSRLATKAAAADVLVVTATPIPRTLALTIYGDLDAATIDELPSGRRPIITRWLQEARRDELYALVRQELAQGRQGYVVYPLIDPSSTKDLRAAAQMAKHLQADIFPEFRVGLLHGRMKPAVKDQTMRAFVRGDIHLLVSTAIVEVGIDVANATVMVIEHPERFGLAQLHQLRGRIGRGAHPAVCIVIADGEESLRQRLTAFVETSDGFELAERDLEHRGPGELMGRRQSGWLRFRLANLARDKELLEAARREAQALIERDPGLKEPAHGLLRERLERYRREST
jgi:ATP-dependent DNA helicase RecG